MSRTVLRYPIDAARPTIAYQLILDYSLGLPNVAETPTIGYPFELTQLTLSADRDAVDVHHVTLLLATNPYVSGEARGGYILHRMTGDLVNADARNFPYRAAFPLTLKPRIRVPQAGYRIRVVRDVVVAAPGLRVLLILTPLD
jgi:hypothetical protein